MQYEMKTNPKSMQLFKPLNFFSQYMLTIHVVCKSMKCDYD